MPFDLDAWKAQLAERLPDWKLRMQRAGVNSIYASLSAMCLWPVIEAFQKGDIAPLLALGGVLGGVGSNLIANRIQNWKDKSEAQVAQEIAARAPQDEALRAALDMVLEKLAALPLAAQGLSEGDRQWFEQTLQEELSRLGSPLQAPSVSVGSGAYVQGQGAIGVGAGGVVIMGKVGGNFVGPGGVLIKQGEPQPSDSDKATQARRRYLERLRRSCQALPLAAMGGEETAVEEITLDKVYIDLDTTTRIATGKVEGKKHRAQAALAPGEEGRLLPALEAAAQSPRLALLGDPGAGKSTFVHKLLAWLAAANLGEVTPPEGFTAGLLPILIVLRDLAPRLGSLELDALPADRQQAELLQAVRQHLRAQVALVDAADFGDSLCRTLGDGECLLALDGLDEVPQALRGRARRAVAALVQDCRPQRVIVTCRVRSYTGEAVLSGFEAHTLAPFDEAKMWAFARAWYDAQVQLGRLDAGQAGRRAQNLAEAALSPHLRELASNPMMLTSMAIIHQQEIGLPRERVRLYNLVVDVLLRRWQKRKMGDLVPSPALAAFLKDDLRLRAALERLAYQAQRAGQAVKGEADLPRGQALELLETAEHLGEPGLASEFLDYVDQRAGLLVGRGGELGRPTAYTFPHRTFQEYLAGCYLAGQRDLGRAFFAHAGEGDAWDLAARLGMEELYYNRRGANALLDLAYLLCPAAFPDQAQGQRALLWSGQMAALLGGEAVARDQGSPQGGEVYLVRLRPHLVELLASPRLPPLERAEAGRALAALGDPRPEAVEVDGMQFCWVPAGPFWMGDESLLHEVELPGYWIGRYPVTNAQFAEFVRAGGYQEARFWREARAAKRWKGGVVIRRIWREGEWIEERQDHPHDFGEPYNLPNHPVAGVAWYEALAFTRWLSERWRAQGWQARLPSEAEWEKAARGGLQLPTALVARAMRQGLAPPSAEFEWSENPASKRRYPWGDEFEPDRANAEMRVGGSSAVGCFSRGASPYGVQDLSGNVWEWTRSKDKKYPYDPEDGREELKGDDPRVLRGGAFYSDPWGVRCAYRPRHDPGLGYSSVGFRVVVSLLPLGAEVPGPLGR